MTVLQGYMKVLVDRLEAMERQLSSPSISLIDDLIDNAEFIQLMRISHRTAQKWRDEGKVPSYKIGNKIYYKLSEIDALLLRPRNFSSKI